MGKMINYFNEEVEFKGCPGCAYARHDFKLPSGMAYENEKFTLSQDWELPIPGFMIVSPKRCIEKFSELTEEEKIEIFKIVDKTILILRNNNICDRFDVIFEEKENRHFHIWIMPRQKWMLEIVDDIIDNIGKIFEYAKLNFRTEDNYIRIKEITDIVKKELQNDFDLMMKSLHNNLD